MLEQVLEVVTPFTTRWQEKAAAHSSQNRRRETVETSCRFCYFLRGQTADSRLGTNITSSSLGRENRFRQHICVNYATCSGRAFSKWKRTVMSFTFGGFSTVAGASRAGFAWRELCAEGGCVVPEGKVI